MHGQPRSRSKPPHDSELVDLVIARLVHRGVVTHEALVAEGVDPRSIEHRLRRKRLIKLWRGVYLVGHGDPAPFALEYAALRFAGPTATLSDRPAAAIYRLLPCQVDPTIHLPLGEKRASPAGLHLHTRDLDPQEVTTVHGDLRITTPERTILDIAPTLDDEQLENVIALAIRNRLTTERKLEAQLDRRRGHRGTKRVRQVLDLGPEWTASRAERVFLQMLRDAELPLPQANARLGRRMPDFLWKEHRVLVEIDSWRWHGDRRAFESDTDRHGRWTAQGWTVLKFTPRQLRDQPLLVIARVTAALTRGG